MSQTYAAQLPVRGRRVLVVGAGPQTVGQVAALHQAGADVCVVAAQAEASIEDLADRGLIRWERRDWRSSDLTEAWLVICDQEDDPLATACTQQRVWLVVPPATRQGPDRLTGQAEPAPRRGRVTLVGGGPGDPGLLTVAGLTALQEADVVVTDRLAPLAALSDLANAPTVIDVAKVPGGRATRQERINELLVDHAREGAHVVRLKGGDPFVFGRGGEEALACADAGIPVQVVPGVTSAVAAPELAGVPVTHRGLSQGFTVVSGHLPPGDPGSTVDYAALARSGTTLVLLMAVAHLEAITDALVQAGMPTDTPCAVVADAAMATQRVVRAPLHTVASTAQQQGIRSPAVVVVGAVAGLSSDLEQTLQAASPAS